MSRLKWERWKLKWAVVQTHSQASNRVAEELTRQAFEFYNPLILHRVRRGRKVLYSKAQLFQNYIFVKVMDRWRALASTMGVQSVLMSGPEKPAVIPDEFIRSIKSMERNSYVVLPKPRKVFAYGQRVVSQSGAFAGTVGLYDGQTSEDRVFVLFGSMRARVKEDDLAVA